MTSSSPAARQAGEVHPAQLRQALGKFASGVTVVTTSGGLGGHEVHGMTANAFSSVSLRPPLVLVSVSNSAHLHPRIAETGRYGISILGRRQESLAQHFAGRESHPELVRFVWRDGLPLIDAALVHLTCSVVNSHLAGDHTIYVAHVDTVAQLDGPPLVFHDGLLRGVDAG
ncbi:MAG: flavin reductase family protein [Actinomycetota bacterium]|nr:flavin reductase family protein [Actinomycetota bacterium]